MIKIGITGRNGFIGSHLYNTLNLFPEKFECIEHNIPYFNNQKALDEFVMQCDVIVHLAALNRDNDPNTIYDVNIKLVEKLIASLIRTKSNAHVFFSSSSQEENLNAYGKSKKDGRELFEKWAKKTKNTFTGLVIPNVFGPFGKPFYNSVIATFSHQLTHGEKPTIETDNELNLIYIGELVSLIIEKIKESKNEPLLLVKPTAKAKVSHILNLLKTYKTEYLDNGEIPSINNLFELNLFNSFRCYLDIKSHFPVKFTKHTDSRGSFCEVIRLGVGGQVSFSTTIPGITRGNHFHTRKIERFAVIKGKALIQLRKIGTNDVLDFYLDGNEPAYVDMPIWYTHNIKNIGDEVLYTNFWINEPYNEEDADTYFENVIEY